jgi:hypothetical protein
MARSLDLAADGDARSQAFIASSSCADLLQESCSCCCCMRLKNNSLGTRHMLYPGDIPGKHGRMQGIPGTILEMRPMEVFLDPFFILYSGHQIF